MLKFDKQYHTYTNLLTSEIYTSCSTFIGKFKPPFDFEKLSALVAKRDGITQQQVNTMWKDNNKAACDYGTAVHLVLENWIKGKPLKSEDAKIVKLLSDMWSPPFAVTSEKMLWDHEYKIAGTIDVYEDHGKYFNIFDFKTNKKFTFNNEYGNRMLPPLNHITVSEYSGYSLQLSLYAYMQEKLTGQRVGELACFYFDKVQFKWFKYNTPYLKNDVERMLNWFC